MTLTKTEKGRGKGVELVGVPSVSRREMSRSKETQGECLTTWHKSDYLSRRRRDLKGTRAGARSFRPVYNDNLITHGVNQESCVVVVVVFSKLKSYFINKKKVSYKFLLVKVLKAYKLMSPPPSISTISYLPF